METKTLSTLPLTRAKTVLRPDPSRVLLRQFDPGDSQRIRGIIQRILALPESEIATLLEQVWVDFSRRHLHLRQRFLDRFEQLRGLLPSDAVVSEQRKLLVGSYFLLEYSVESAALFSPSMVPHPDQTNLPDGAVRFVLSLRSIGEGHISSISFRSGIVFADLHIEMDPTGSLLSEPRPIANTLYEGPLFQRKLRELGLQGDFPARVSAGLGDSFSLETLREVLTAELQRSGQAAEDQLQAQSIWMLARSNYEVQFEPEQDLSERIIFPSTPPQRNGIEDARFVRFRNDDGTHVYFATFTAYDGRVIMPEILETSGLSPLFFYLLEWPRSSEQGHGAVPAKGQWFLRHALAAG